MNVRALSLVPLLAGPVLAGDAGVPRVLLDRTLAETPITLTAIDRRTITYLDVGGLVRTEALSEYIALLPPPGTEPEPAPVPGVHLVSGERLAGGPVEAETGEVLRWRHPAFGVLDIRLEDVARIVISPAKRGEARPAAEGDDLVLLANGDTVSGFVAGIGGSLRVESGGSARDIPMSVVAEVRLSNPARPAGGMTAWLADGSVVGVGSLSTGGAGQVRLVPRLVPATEAPDSGDRPLTLEDLVAVSFDSSGVVALAAAPVLAQRAAEGRIRAGPVEVGPAEGALLGTPDITIPGPMSVDWAMPEGATRFGCVAELPAAMWDWGDCEAIVVAIDGAGKETELFRRRLNADHPTATVNEALPAGVARLRIVIDPGLYGPIQDRVILRRPLLLAPTRPG